MPVRSRSERLERVRDKRKRVLAIVGAVAAVAVVAALAAVGASVLRARATAPEVDLAALEMASNESTGLASAMASETPTVLVEVPQVTGTPVDEAELLLGVAGLDVILVSTPPGEAATGTVLAQTPAAGERVASGSKIELVWADSAATVAATAGIALATSAAEGPIVCIDPGHQAVANNEPEPVGPGSTETKPKVSGGGTGVATGQTEYALTLALSLEVKERLEARGVTVVLTRSANEVDISNAQRAAIANQAGAELFVRIHADSSTNADLRGISLLYPGGNDWVAPIQDESYLAAKAVHETVIRATEAETRGIAKRADLAGFNHATVPSILIETGFLSNPMDDRALADSAYRDRLAEGIAQGVLDYLGM